jgi:hypothetical protein
MIPDTVYLVEERTGGQGGMRYWHTVYLTSDQARTAVERQVVKAGASPLRWQPGFVPIGEPTSGDGTGSSYAIVPLGVHK